MSVLRRLPIRRRLRIATLASALGIALGVAAMATDAMPLAILAAFLVVCAAAYLALLGDRLVADVEATRGAVLAAGSDGRLPPLRSDMRPLTEVAELRDAISRRLSDVATVVGNHQLIQVIAALPDAVIVATPEGLVSAVNHPGRLVFGKDRDVVGTSLFGRLSRQSLSGALRSAERSGRPCASRIDTVDGETLPVVIASLGDATGFVLLVRRDDVPVDHRAEIEIDLGLHEVPPRVPPPEASTPLVDLPVLVLDTETTGLLPESDRIVAIGAVRMHGPRLFRRRTIDMLVRPGRPIPLAASAVHRITDAMVADAPEIAEVWPQVLEALDGLAAVGHHIDFDLAMLKAAAERNGLPWLEPLALDTARLAAALDPTERDLDLAAVAQRYGVFATGRHTALGDSLVTAEIYVRILPRLLDRGIVTLGDAIRFGETATAVVAAQRATAWGRR